MERREFLGSVGVAAAGAAALSLAACGDDDGGRRWWQRGRADDDWEGVRRSFPIDRDYIHMAGMLITSHPRALARSIGEHRSGLDVNPAAYVEDRNRELESAARSAAADYLGASAGDVALTQSTTEAIALVYNGLEIGAGQQMLTTTHDYYSTRESLRYKARRTGADVRTIEPFGDSATATADEVADRIASAVTPATRIVALTWVHSWTGIKIPIRQVAERVATRAGGADNVLIGLDGVHALGVEDFNVTDLGCDFFMAGAHKWLFGPRGTGVLWGKPAAQAERSIIASVTPYDVPHARLSPGLLNTPAEVDAVLEAIRDLG